MPGERAALAVIHYLRPEEEVVPFRVRPELHELLSWCAAEDHVAVRLVTGDGGAGKTRLALRLSQKMAANGWQPLWVRPGLESQLVSAVRELETPCVVVVDYAETRDGLGAMLNDVARESGGPDMRVVLLARGSGEWWQRMINSTNEQVARLLTTPPIMLGPIYVKDGQDELFAEALTAFAVKLGRDRPGTPLMLTDPEPVVLDVHAAALLAVLDHAQRAGDGKAQSRGEVLKNLLAHEGRYWAQSAAARRLDLDVAVQRLVVVAGCLIGADSEASAAGLMTRIPDLVDSADRRGKVARWLHDLYPETSHAQAGTREWIGPLRPDPVAEYLVVAALNHRPDMIPGLFTNLGNDRAARALTVLARAAHTQPSALNLLRDAFAADLEHLAVPALSVAVETNPVLGELLSKALQSDQISAGTLEQIANTALYPSFVLADSAVVVLKRLADNSADDGERARRLLDLSSWQSDLGRLEEALATTEQAVRLYRQLAEDRPDAFLPSLARSLNNLSAHLTKLGRPLEALATMEEASSIYRQLAEADPGAFRLDLAMSLNNQSEYLATVGRREEALATIEQAVGIYWQLAATRPDAFPPALAKSLNNQSLRLADLGRWEKALATSEQAVGFYRQLAKVRPDAFLPDLARSLRGMAKCLGGLERREEARATVKQAVTICRQLAEARPDAFLPDLAGSLCDMAKCQGNLERWEEALATIEETVSLYRRLAQVRPKLFGRSLSHSLELLAAILSELGRSETIRTIRAEAESIRMTPEQKELLRHGLLIAAAYLRDDSVEQERLTGSFLPEGRFSLLADAFTCVAVLATDTIAAVQGKSFHEVLQSVAEHTEVFLLPGLPVGPWDEALLLASAVKWGGDDEARRTPLTMNIPSAINVMFRLAISALTDLANVPQFAHMTPLAVAEMLVTVTEDGYANG